MSNSFWDWGSRSCSFIVMERKMTAISSASQTVQFRPPLAQLLTTRSSSAKARSAGETSLASALESFNSNSTQAKDSKDKLTSLIDSLIAKGVLTTDQASEIKSALEKALKGITEGGASAASVSATAAEEVPDPDNDVPDPDADVPPPDDGSSSISTNSDIAQLLKKLLEKLRSSATTTYSNGAKANTGFSSLFVDKAA